MPKPVPTTLSMTAAKMENRAPSAQPAELLLEMLRRGWAARTPVDIIAGGESCGVDGC